MKYILFLFVLISIAACKTKSVVNGSHYAEEISHHRIEYKADFIKDERSPLREPDFKYMNFYDADENYKCNCTFVSTPDAKPFQMATVSGKTQFFTKHGIATCPINGKSIEVNIYASQRTQSMPGYADHLFIPFKDMTSGEETYGGGRYIDIKTGDIVDNNVTIDFNKCYNPWCMYSEGYNCPIPPRENHLTAQIEAGEKIWTGKKKH